MARGETKHGTQNKISMRYWPVCEKNCRLYELHLDRLPENTIKRFKMAVKVCKPLLDCCISVIY